MLVAKAMLELPGVDDAAVVMGTPANREILAAAAADRGRSGRPADDLVIVVRVADEVSGEAALARRRTAGGPCSKTRSAQRPRSLAAAVAAGRCQPGGDFGGRPVCRREARTALQRGLHVLLFSDNVPLDDEIALKQLAVERGCCAWARTPGRPLSTAWRWASPTPCRVAGGVGQRGGHGPAGRDLRAGAGRRGISQAIGTGGRDLSEPVGGLMMLPGSGAPGRPGDRGDRVDLEAPGGGGRGASARRRQVVRQARRGLLPGRRSPPIEAAGACRRPPLAQAAAAGGGARPGGDVAAALGRWNRERMPDPPR